MSNHSRTARKKFHFIYVTTCFVSGRYYIGMHSTDDLDDGYIGSGKRLWQSIKKHGREQHKLEILEFLPTRAALRVREAEHVNEERIKLDPFCMNIAEGGQGGWEHVNAAGLNGKNFKSPDEQRKYGVRGQKVLKALWTDPTYKAKRSAISRDICDTERLTFKGRKHSEETKKQMSVSHQGKHAGEKNHQFGTKWSAERRAKVAATWLLKESIYDRS